ncbi:MAG: magnesium transporter [bacterium]|nr:magnesium transporter [bacterium]
MLKQLLGPDIRDIIRERNWPALKEGLAAWPPPEVADLLMSLDRNDRVLLFRALPRRHAADVFAYLDRRQQDVVLRELTDGETGQLMADLRPDDRTALLEEMPAAVTRRLLHFLGPEDRREASRLLGYPEESVGRLMTPNYVAVRPEWTIRQALDHIRRWGKDSETVNMVYVTDESGRLLDDIKLRRFILADTEEKVGQIMDGSFVSVSAFDDREKAVRTIRRYDLVALPVVDSENVLLGIVTVDDLMDVQEREASEDFQKIAAVSVERGDGMIASIRDAPIPLLYRRRISWLLLLVFVNLFSGAAMACFEATIARVVALVFFLPLLIDSSGNAGTQAATLMVRALATGDVRAGDWARMILRELATAAALGISMGLAVSVVGLYRGGPRLALVTSLAMAVVVVVGSVIGMSLPFILTRLRRDPAAASAPLVTSLCDIIGVLVYFSIAEWLL